MVKRQDNRSENANGLQIASGTILPSNRFTRPSCINENKVIYAY